MALRARTQSALICSETSITAAQEYQLRTNRSRARLLMLVNVKVSSLTYNYSVSIYGDTSSLGRSQ
jgi:hypothetical protein